MLEDLLSSLPGNLLAIHSTKSLTGYLEISFECAWGPLCLLECLNPIIESPLVSTARNTVIERKEGK